MKIAENDHVTSIFKSGHFWKLSGLCTKCTLAVAGDPGEMATPSGQNEVCDGVDSLPARSFKRAVSLISLEL